MLADIDTTKADDQADHNGRHGHVAETDTGLDMGFGGGNPIVAAEATSIFEKYRWRSQHRYRAAASRHGTIIQHRPDNSAMHPVGRPRPHPPPERFPFPVVALDYRDIIDRSDRTHAG